MTMESTISQKVDKYKSEKFRLLFKEKVSIASNYKIHDNFSSFYKKVFEKVKIPPELKPSYHCVLCKEDFISEDDHDIMIMKPYADFITNGDSPLPLEREKYFIKYLKADIGKTFLSYEPLPKATGDWAGNKIQTSFYIYRSLLQPLKSSSETDFDAQVKKLKRSANFANISLTTDQDGFSDFISAVLYHRHASLNNICDNLLPQINNLAPQVFTDVMEIELLIPAMIREFRPADEWSKLHWTLSKIAPRLSLLLAIVNQDADEESFVRLGERFLEEGELSPNESLQYAHLAFTLAKIPDFSKLADSLIKKFPKNFSAIVLAAFYISESGDFEKLESLGKSADFLQEIFFMPTILHFYDEGNLDKVVQLLCSWLPMDKLWNCVQRLVSEHPKQIFMSQWVMRIVLEKLLDILIDPSEMEAKLATIPVHDGECPLSRVIYSLSGCLHLLYKNYDYHKDHPQFQMLVKACFKASLCQNKFEALVAFSRIPRILSLITMSLKEYRFLGQNLVEIEDESDHHNGLLLLRAIYYYKENRIDDIIQDLKIATRNSKDYQILKAITYFIASNPIIQEKVLRTSHDQFSKLFFFIKNYKKNGAEIIPVNIEQILKPLPKWDHINALATDKLAEEGYIFLETASASPTEAERISAVCMATGYFIHAMFSVPMSASSVPENFGYFKLIMQCVDQLYNSYDSRSEGPPTALVLLALRLATIRAFLAARHVGHVVRKFPREFGFKEIFKPKIKPIESDSGTIASFTKKWQDALSWRMMLPMLTHDLFEMTEGQAATLTFCDQLYANLFDNFIANKKKQNAPKCLFDCAKLNKSWGHKIEYQVEIALPE